MLLCKVDRRTRREIRESWFLLSRILLRREAPRRLSCKFQRTTWCGVVDLSELSPKTFNVNCETESMTSRAEGKSNIHSWIKSLRSALAVELSLTDLRSE